MREAKTHIQVSEGQETRWKNRNKKFGGDDDSDEHDEVKAKEKSNSS